LTPWQGLAYLIYQVPTVLVYCLPIATLFASVFLFRQMSLSSELTAIMASGVSFRRILIPIGMVGASMSLLFVLTQEWFVPEASKALYALNAQTQFEENAEEHHQVTYVERGPDGSMDKFLVISPKAKTDMNQFIFLFFTGKGPETRIWRMITATQGRWSDQDKGWLLSDGIDYQLNEEGIYQTVASFGLKLVHTSDMAQAFLSFPPGRPTEYRLADLQKYVRLLGLGGQSEDERFYKVRLYQRYFLAFIPIVFAVLGACLGVERSRATRNLGLTYAAVFLLFYNVMVPVCTTLGSIGFLPPLAAAFIPLLLALGSGKVLLTLRQRFG
jgi:lipopolysaccharide export system permease protein